MSFFLPLGASRGFHATNWKRAEVFCIVQKINYYIFSIGYEYIAATFVMARKLL